MQLLPFWCIYIAALMRLGGGVAYVRATLAGRARPHAVSWTIWAITPLISFAAELSAGVGIIALVTLALGLSPMFVVLAALKTDRTLFRVDRFDAFCIAVAVLGVVLWAITREPVTAIILAISADTISCIPTIRKTWHHPETEYPPTFLFSAASMVLALLATREVSFIAFAFPVYVLSMNLLILSLSLRRVKKFVAKKRAIKRRALTAKKRTARRRAN